MFYEVKLKSHVKRQCLHQNVINQMRDITKDFDTPTTKSFR